MNQRWHRGREAWRPSGEIINTARYGVEEIPYTVAKSFVEEHHYSGSYPVDRHRVGLFECANGQPSTLVGVAVFSVPPQQKAITARTGLPSYQGVELGRFVLLDHVPGNGETWFLARAFVDLVRAIPTVRAVLSYSDPVPRHTAEGRVVTPGHVGTIYQAHNGMYVGRGRRRTLHIDTNGRVISPRSISKIRNDERGADGAYRRLIAAGAPRRQTGEDPRAYISRALTEGPFTQVRHPGNYAYVWGLDTATKRRLRQDLPALAYPKQIEPVGAQMPLFGAAV